MKIRTYLFGLRFFEQLAEHGENEMLSVKKLGMNSMMSCKGMEVYIRDKKVRA
jgi:hypothetical protein